MPGLDLPKKDAGDALNKYRIKDSPSGGAAALSPSPLSPTGVDSERRDEEELRALSQQLATFNRRLTEESLDKYRVQPTKKPEGDQKSENEEAEFQIDEAERRQLEAEMQRLLTRKHTLELRRSQRSAGDQASETTTATATASAPARAPAGLDRFRVQPSSAGGPGSAPVTPTATSSSSSSSLAAPVDKNRRLSVSGSDLTVRPTTSSSSVSPPQAKPAPLSQTQVGLTASAPPRIKSLPVTSPVASFNKPTTPTGTSATSGCLGFATPKVKTSFGLPSPRSANANADPFSKYRVQNDATAATASGATTVVAEVRPLTPTVSDPFSKYRIAPSGGGSSEASPLASPASAEAVRDVKPAAVDPLSKYRKQPDATSSAAAAPSSPPKPVAEAAKSSSRPEVAKIAIPDGSHLHSDEEGTT